MRNANQNKLIVCDGRIIDTSRPQIMAIINATPDSFYSGSRRSGKNEIIAAATSAVESGASILDVGGYSTRPGAAEVCEREELERVGTALRCIREIYPEVPISVDTFRGSVARMAVREYNANIINDISAFELDKEMLPAIIELQVPYILMHSKGTPQTMQSMTSYDDFLTDILRFFAHKINVLRESGFDKEIIIDPGYGFAKTTEQNYTLLRELHVFETFNAPLLVGISRKSMIFKPLNLTPDTALNGTTALNSFALDRGANILRVHDTREAAEAIKLHSLLMGNSAE